MEFAEELQASEGLGSIDKDQGNQEDYPVCNG